MSDDVMDLSRRERQIMDVVYEKGRATAGEIQSEIPDPPSYSAVRALLRVLVDKGHLRYKQEGPRYHYEPKRPAKQLRKNVMERVLRTFFGDSTEDAMAALLDLKERELTDQELDRLERLIQERRHGGTD